MTVKILDNFNYHQEYFWNCNLPAIRERNCSMMRTASSSHSDLLRGIDEYMYQQFDWDHPHLTTEIFASRYFGIIAIFPLAWASGPNPHGLDTVHDFAAMRIWSCVLPLCSSIPKMDVSWCAYMRCCSAGCDIIYMSGVCFGVWVEWI